MFLDIMDDGFRNQVADTHLPSKEQAYLCAANIVLNELLDDVDVVSPGLKTSEGFVDIRATAFDYECL